MNALLSRVPPVEAGPDRTDPVERAVRELVASTDAEALRAGFREDEILVLPDFLPAPLLSQLVDETRQLLPLVRRSHLPFVRKGGAVSHPVIRARAPGLFALQASPPLRGLFQHIANGPILEPRKPDDAHAFMGRPPIVVPDAQCATAEEIFRPVDSAALPEIADVLAYLAEHEPDVLAAVEDVDRTLLWPQEGVTPFSHARACARTMANLMTFGERATIRPLDKSAA